MMMMMVMMMMVMIMTINCYDDQDVPENLAIIIAV